jgi:hypothetical protein
MSLEMSFFRIEALAIIKERSCMSQTDQDKATATQRKIIAKAWRAFKAKLSPASHGVLREADVAIPAPVPLRCPSFILDFRSRASRGHWMLY